MRFLQMLLLPLCYFIKTFNYLTISKAYIYMKSGNVIVISTEEIQWQKGNTGSFSKFVWTSHNSLHPFLCEIDLDQIEAICFKN